MTAIDSGLWKFSENNWKADPESRLRGI